jgi:putative DNA primase/helicase
MEDRRTDQLGASKPDTTPASKAASQQAFAACRAVLESEAPLSPAEQAEHRRRLEPPRRPPPPSLTPTQRWDRATPAEATHPYLKAKGIRPHGTRREGDHLLIPIRRGTGLIGLQAIAPAGTQRILDGGEVAGGYCAIGKPKGLLCIATSFAAGASIHEATGHAVAVAFTADNLAAVARGLRERLPAIPLVVCADADAGQGAKSNQAQVTAVAREVGGVVAVPDFGADRPAGATGFSDLRRLRGDSAVVAAITRALGARKSDASSDASAGRASASPPVDRRIDAPPVALHLPVAYRRLSEVDEKPIRWLWPGRFARGKVTLIAGDPGLGKSQVTASMAAIVTTGGQWPVDRCPCAPGNVVVLSAEDDAADTIKPRMRAAGADLSRVFVLDAVRDLDEEGKAIARSFNLRTDLDRLDALLAAIGEVAMVVIDPISAYLGGTDSHKNADVRALLGPLGELAAQHGLTIVCVSHLNKGVGGDALLRVTGSLAFVAAARSAFIVLKDKDQPTRRLFLPIKNNLGSDCSGLAFELSGVKLDSAAGPIDTCHVVWDSEPVEMTANEAMSQTDASTTDGAEGFTPARWLAALLRANGPMLQAEANKRGEEVGISARTLRRASEKLKVNRRKLSFSKGWEWSLSTEATQAFQGAQDAQDAQDAPTRPRADGGRLGLLPSPGAPSADEELATGDYEVF